MPEPRKSFPLIAALGVLASSVSLAASTASTASATPAGDTSGSIAFSPGTASGGGTSFGGKTITSVAPDGTSHTWQPAGTLDGPITGGYKYLTGLAYSPDGTKIAYSVDHARLWVSNADGTDDHLVTTGGLMAGNTIGGGYSIETVQWSPDGQYIYYLHVTKDTHSVRRVRPNSTGEQTLFTAPGGNAFSFSVAPDGDIATDVLGAGGQPSISIWHAATNVLSPTGITGYEPDFSPDGSTLLYTTNGQGFQTLYTTKADGTGQPRLVTGGVEALSKPVWSPDGSAIAYGTMSGVMEYFPATSSSKPIANVAGAISLTWQPHAAGAAPATPRTIDRVGGADRIDTAVDASRFEFAAAAASGRQAKTAVLSRSDTYADALAGSALAAAKTGPLLLTSGTGLDARVRAELHRVLPAGSTVYLLGGNGALSPAVEQAVRAAGYTPKRLAGSDRYATSLAIAEEITPNPATVLVATGNDYPDALGAGAYAGAHANAVVVLSAGKTLTPAVRSYVAGAFADPDAQVIAVGGPGGEAVYSAFSADFLSPLTPVRFFPVGGSDRYATAAELAGLNGNHDIVALATGSGWADALAGGAVAGLNGASLFLTHGTAITQQEEDFWGKELDPKTGQWTGPQDPIFTAGEIIAFGGPAVIPDRDVAAQAALTGQDDWVTQVDRSAPPLP